MSPGRVSVAAWPIREDGARLAAPASAERMSHGRLGSYGTHWGSLESQSTPMIAARLIVNILRFLVEHFGWRMIVIPLGLLFAAWVIQCAVYLTGLPLILVALAVGVCAILATLITLKLLDLKAEHDLDSWNPSPDEFKAMLRIYDAERAED